MLCIVVRDKFGDVHAEEISSDPHESLCSLVNSLSFDTGEEIEYGVCKAKDAGAARLSTRWEKYRTYLTLSEMSGPLPPLAGLANLVQSLASQTNDDCPEIEIAIGWNPGDGSWSYQTGDNSFFGGAYGFPVWSVGFIEEADTDLSIALETAQELIDDLRENAPEEWQDIVAESCEHIREMIERIK